MNREELWKLDDKIEALKVKKGLIGLTESEELELRNLEIKFMNEWDNQNQF